MAPSNLAVLTKSHRIIAQKKRAKKEQVKEVVFDEDARRDFLTGFHKRKVQKKEAAKAKAVLREKEERLEARRENRRMLAQRAVENAAEVEKAYGAAGDDEGSDEWDGLAESSGRRKGKGRADEKEEEFEGEETLATVTVVEDFDPDELLHGPKQTDAMDEDEDGHAEQLPPPKPTQQKSYPEATKAKAATSTKKLQSKDPKKIKYQTNAARKVERAKQQKRKVEKATRAGGKGSRKRGGKR
ncbi:nucleolar protein 12-domain-containing protein [Phanerochaete sordida]|uniref:Nucleolar protein 12-domain-containing protein n=1 Tax=Phanerochaete sordida TaxID=48140 RepID=A0A9P3LJ51_9APHY|nr:nucleolar protein 12-domain-containing protein [Phanerochaete sordida]